MRSYITASLYRVKNDKREEKFRGAGVIFRLLCMK